MSIIFRTISLITLTTNQNQSIQRFPRLVAKVEAAGAYVITPRSNTFISFEFELSVIFEISLQLSKIMTTTISDVIPFYNCKQKRRFSIHCNLQLYICNTLGTFVTDILILVKTGLVLITPKIPTGL